MKKTKETQKRRFREFKELVLEQLQDPEFAKAYRDESLKEDDQGKFLFHDKKNDVSKKEEDCSSW